MRFMGVVLYFTGVSYLLMDVLQFLHALSQKLKASLVKSVTNS